MHVYGKYVVTSARNECTTQRSGDLLEDLQTLAGFEYLSDTKLGANRSKVTGVLNDMKMDDYSLKQWGEALSYILQETVHADSEGDILRCIENMM